MPINLCIIISQVKRKSKGNRQISLLFEVFHSTVIAMKWQTRAIVVLGELAHHIVLIVISHNCINHLHKQNLLATLRRPSQGRTQLI